MRTTTLGREMRMETVVGAFIVMIMLGLGYFTIALSKTPFFGKKKYRIEVVFHDVMGLRKEDNVVIRGMTAGTVKHLDLQKDGVHVYLSLDHEPHITNDYKMSIVSTSILGGRYLQIEEGSPGHRELPLDFPFRGREPHDLMADAAEFVNKLKQGAVEGGMIDNFLAVSEQLKEVTTRVSSGKGMMGKLLSEDEKLFNDLSAGVESFKNISQRMDKGEGSLGKLLSKDDQVYKDLAASVASLRRVSEKIEKGEGVLGKLVNDDNLYKDIEKTIKEVRATVDDYRETMPVVTFTSVFFGAF
jgi:phospholipid/cholesterol/gamma-HCH transport system substrate-binding protein